MVSSLMQKMKKNSTIENAAVLSKSELFKNKEFIKLPIPAMNLAFSGKLDGGFSNGLIQLAGPSKHFKSNMALVLVKAFLDKEEEGVVLFYDSEFGSTEDYFKNAGIDVERVLHLPILNIEEFKFDVMKKLEELDVKTDKVLIFVDSVGNTASKKEMEDALNEKSVGDMTRAKMIKQVFRLVTPYLTLKKVPMIVINHTYQTQEMYSKTVVSGGTGIEYSSNSIFTIGKQQIKEGKVLEGFDFVLNCNKSRYIKEKAAIPITVTFAGGIEKYSGLMDIAKSIGWVESRSAGSKGNVYTRPKLAVGGDLEFKKDKITSAEFWEPLLADKKFCSEVESMFLLTSAKLFTFDDEGNAIIMNSAPEEAVEEVIDFDLETGEIFEEA